MNPIPRAADPDEDDEEEERRHPSEWRPLCDEPEFAALLENVVADYAPRLFAVVHEYGTRADGFIVGWGMEFEGHATVVGVDNDMRVRMSTAEGTRWMFDRYQDDGIRARLVWFNPDAASPPDDNA